MDKLRDELSLLEKKLNLLKEKRKHSFIEANQMVYRAITGDGGVYMKRYESIKKIKDKYMKIKNKVNLQIKQKERLKRKKIQDAKQKITDEYILEVEKLKDIWNKAKLERKKEIELAEIEFYNQIKIIRGSLEQKKIELEAKYDKDINFIVKKINDLRIKLAKM